MGSVLIALGGTSGVTLSQPADKPPQETAPPAAQPTVDPLVPAAEPPPAPTSADFGRPAAAAEKDTATPAAPAIDWTTQPIDQVRAKANANDIPAMEEFARRLIQGIGVPKDQQAGAGWMLRAAQRGSAQSAFNVGVMYERGFVVERDSARAIEWYRKAADAGLAMAKHNLALMLREGKGAPRDGNEAIELLRSAARQGMSASMFTLGDIYDRGDVIPKDQAMALAWFAITAEFESQTNRDGDSQLGRTAAQRAQTLKRILLPGELERAQQYGQAEFKQIVAALQPPKPAPLSNPNETAPASPATAPESDPPGWPRSTADQVRAVQQALFDLKLVRDKPDGTIGPVTRAAIRSFQRNANLRETGEPSKEVYAALKAALAKAEAKPETAAEPAKPDTAKAEEPRPSAVAAAEPAKPEPPTAADPPGWPKATIDQVKAIQQALVDLNLSRDKPDGDIGPVTRDAIRAFQRSANLRETGEPTKDVYAALQEAVARRKAEPDPPGWPKAPVEQVKAIQQALFDLGLLRNKPDGDVGPGTRDAIRAFQRDANLRETGEPTRDVYAALQEANARRAGSKPATEPSKSAAPATSDPPGWPQATIDQVKAIQQALLDLDLLRDKPDGDVGPTTRNAIRTFQRTANLPETGEPTKDVYAALQDAVGRRDARSSPASGPRAGAVIDPTPQQPPKVDPNAWPATETEQVKAIQQLLRELNFSGDEPDGLQGPQTRAAIIDYQRSIGLEETGQTSKALFDSLREMRNLTGRKAN
ncbi:MAG: SEL1-like repeat protein [Reyranellaceae bacterium]